MHWFHAKLAKFWAEDDREWDEHTATPEMVSARKASKAFFFGFLYGQGNTIRGFNLTIGKIIQWRNTTTNQTGSCCQGEETLLLNFSQEEYNAAKSAIERRLTFMNSTYLFPLKKDMFVGYTEDLIYQTIYGAQVAKNFLANLDGMQDLIKSCQQQSRATGYVEALDGRKLFSRSPHSSLNLLLQGSAGVVAKKWMVNYHQIAYEKYNIYDPRDFRQQCFVHDEFDCIVKPTAADTLCAALEEGASKVTSDFNLNIPIKADAIKGFSWYDCH